MRLWRSIIAGLATLAVGASAIAADPAKLSPSVVPPEVARSAPGAPAMIPVPAGAHALTADDVNAWLDGFMPNALHNGDIAGAVVTVVKDGQIISARGYGWADEAKHVPVDPYKTLFRPGSVSKLFTWTAVMQLVEQGKINLDADVNTYLDFKIPPRNGQPITMRQIMTHTAGFEEAVKDLITYDSKHVMSFDAYLKRWTPRRIFDAGTTPAYSNWATTLAGYIIERVSGQDFYTYVEQHEFQPLGMQYSSFRQPLPANLAPYMSRGYPRASQPPKAFEVITAAPAGSLSASGVDMAKFMIAHLEQGRGLLKPMTAAMMHNSPLDKVNPRSLIPPLNRMELGFFETNINGHEVIGHLGDTENQHTSLHLFMNDGVGLYVSFNSAGKEGGAHTARIALFQDFADRYFPQPQPTTRVDATTAKSHAEAMAGTWEASRRSDSNFWFALSFLGQTKVSVGSKGELVIPSLTGPNGAVKQWDEVSPYVWREHDGHDMVAAQVANGEVVRWSENLEAPFTVFDRVPAGRSSAWLTPAMIGSIVVLLLVLLYWPAAWFVRRRYKAQPTVTTGVELRAYRATRIVAALDLAVLLGWFLFVQGVSSDLTLLDDFGLIMGLQIAGAIFFVGAAAITGWNAWLSWRDDRHLSRKLWNTLVFLAAFCVLYFAATYSLIALAANF